MTLNQTQIKPILLNRLGKIAPEAVLSQLSDHENIQKTLGTDSYDFLNWMIGISEEFAIDIPETDHGQLFSLRDMIRYIKAHLN